MNALPHCEPAGAGTPLPGSKRGVDYLERAAQRYLNRCGSARMPFRWTLNPYRGCEYGCQYCYARSTHEFLDLTGSRDFEEKIFVKRWNRAAFRAEVGRLRAGEPIGIGTATDPYQPAERRFGLTRKMLEVLAGQRGLRLSLVTKSDLIVRDLGLFQEIARHNRLNLNLTITTLDGRLARLLEPRAPRPALRLAAVERLAGAGLDVGVFANPVMPCLTDSEESLDAVAGAAARAGARRFSGGILFLKPCAKRVFLPFLERHFPELAADYRRRYANRAFERGVYAEAVAACVRRLRERYRLGGGEPEDGEAGWEHGPQLELFPILETPVTPPPRAPGGCPGG